MDSRKLIVNVVAKPRGIYDSERNADTIFFKF